jgi:hypothetical protein
MISVDKSTEDELEDSLGSPDRFSNVGIDGPKMSVSRIPDRSPF